MHHALFFRHSNSPVSKICFESGHFTRNLPPNKIVSMAIEIKVPTVGEIINEVTLVRWLKLDGE